MSDEAERTVARQFGFDDRSPARRPNDAARGRAAPRQRWHVRAEVTNACTIEEGEFRNDYDPTTTLREEDGEAFVAVVRLGDLVVDDHARVYNPINEAVRAAFRKAHRLTHGGSDHI